MAQSVHVTLAAHPANPLRFHQHIDATLTHTPDGSLQIVFAIHGLNIDLRVPTPHAPAPHFARATRNGAVKSNASLVDRRRSGLENLSDLLAEIFDRLPETLNRIAGFLKRTR